MWRARGWSLRRRVTLGGVAVVAAVVAVAEVFVFVALRWHLHDSLDVLLEERVQAAEELAADWDGQELAERLSAAGLRGSVITPDGTEWVVQPAARRAPERLPPAPAAGAVVARSVRLATGTEMVVVASRAGVDWTLRRLGALMAVAWVAAVAGSGALLWTLSGVALGPLATLVTWVGGARPGRAPVTPTVGGCPEMLLLADTLVSAWRRAAEEQLRAETAAQRAMAAEGAMRAFLGDAAHHLRTPLTSMRASAEALRAGLEPGDADEILGNLVAESERAGRQVGQLLAMARLDGGSREKRCRADVVALCRREATRASARAGGVAVRLNVGVDAVEAEIAVDQLEEAVANLLDNAIRHAHQAVTVVVAVHAGEVFIDVGDDGPGVPGEAVPRIFERFVSVDGAGGSGLGLAIVRAVAEGHGGEANYTKGRFRMRLPLRPADTRVQRASR